MDKENIFEAREAAIEESTNAMIVKRFLDAKPFESPIIAARL